MICLMGTITLLNCFAYDTSLFSIVQDFNESAKYLILTLVQFPDGHTIGKYFSTQILKNLHMK